MSANDWQAVMNIFTKAFKACVGWFEAIINRLDAQPIILAVIGLALVVGLLLIPLRGAAVSFVGEYTSSKIHSKKYKKLNSDGVKGND